MTEIKYGEITVVMSTGLQQHTPFTTIDNVSTIQLQVIAPGAQSVSVTSDNDSTVTITKTFHSRNQEAVITGLVAVPPSILVTEETTITATFNKEAELTQFMPSIYLSDNLQIKTPWTFNENRDGGSFVVTGIAPSLPGTPDKATVIFGGKTTVLEVTVGEGPALLTNVILDPVSGVVNITESLVVTAVFDKAPNLAEVLLTMDPAFVVSTPPVILGNTVRVTYLATSLTTSPVDLIVSHLDDPIITKSLEVVPLPIITSIVHSPSVVVAGENVIFTINFSQPVTNPADIVLTATPGLTLVTPFTLAGGGMSGTVEYNTTLLGLMSLTAESLTDSSTELTTITTTLPPVISGFVSDISNVEIGDEVTFTIDINPLAGVVIAPGAENAHIALSGIPAAWILVNPLTITGDTITTSYKMSGVAGTYNITATSADDASNESVIITLNSMVTSAISNSDRAVIDNTHIMYMINTNQVIDIITAETPTLTNMSLVSAVSVTPDGTGNEITGVVSGDALGVGRVVTRLALASDTACYEDYEFIITIIPAILVSPISLTANVMPGNDIVVSIVGAIDLTGKTITATTDIATLTTTTTENAVITGSTAEVRFESLAGLTGVNPGIIKISTQDDLETYELDFAVSSPALLTGLGITIVNDGEVAGITPIDCFATLNRPLETGENLEITALNAMDDVVISNVNFSTPTQFDFTLEATTAGNAQVSVSNVVLPGDEVDTTVTFN